MSTPHAIDAQGSVASASTSTSSAPLGLREISTDTSSERDQQAYWREVARWGSAMGMPSFRFEMPEATDGFLSTLRWCQGDGGVHFLEGRTTVTVAQHASADLQGDLIVVGGLRSGSLRIDHGRDRVTIVRAGEMFVSDYGRRMRMRWDPHNFLFLALPRTTVDAALGVRADLGGDTVQSLPNARLVPLLWMHLCMLADHGRQLDAEEWATTLSAGRDIALTVLRHRFGVSAGAGVHSREGLLTAARRYIERHHTHPNLTADQIAHALGCSRSQLYRAFATQQLAVADSIRQVRLDRARAQLASGVAHASIGEIAYACGYTDLSAFGKAFKQRFGTSPSEWRLLARATNDRTGVASPTPGTIDRRFDTLGLTPASTPDSY